jgi:hypothetical protein
MVNSTASLDLERDPDSDQVERGLDKNGLVGAHSGLDSDGARPIALRAISMGVGALRLQKNNHYAGQPSVLARTKMVSETCMVSASTLLLKSQF